MNQFENHDLVTKIHEALRDHGVLKNDAPLAALTTEERRFLEEIDRCITDDAEHAEAMENMVFRPVLGGAS